MTVTSTADCVVDACDRPSRARQMCVTHYQRWRRTGGLLALTWSPQSPIRECQDCGETKASPYAKRCPRCYQRKWVKDNPNKMRARADRRMASKLSVRAHGITAEEYDGLLAEQNGGCAICGTATPDKSRFDIDHDHSCCAGNNSCGDCIRGLLCQPCNRGLSAFRDGIGSLVSAIRYLDSYARGASS